jgi:O-antigen/teichoic acid export membrane protein
VLVFLAVPAVLLLGIALAAPALFLRVVFHHSYAAAAPAMVPLVLAMILLSISVVLTMYLLAIGRRWVAIILTAGALGLVVAVSLVHGHLRNTAVVDLAVQAVVMIVIVIGFTVIHRVRHREHAARLT